MNRGIAFAHTPATATAGGAAVPSVGSQRYEGTAMNSTAVGVFENRTNATGAVSALRSAGFRDEQIGVVSRHRDTTTSNDPTETHWEEGTGVGAAAGAATGVGLGLAVAAGLIPGVGPVIAGGTLMALLASAGAGATVGTVIGGLIGLGVPEDDAAYYESEFNTGRTIVTVRADARYSEAVDILRRHGALERATAIV